MFGKILINKKGLKVAYMLSHYSSIIQFSTHLLYMSVANNYRGNKRVEGIW